jgi:hypothetical protein
MVGGCDWNGLGQSISFLMWPTTLSTFYFPSLYNKIWRGCTSILFLFDPLETWSLVEWPYLVSHMVVESTMLNQQHFIFFELSLLEPIGTTYSFIILNFIFSNIKRNTFAKTGYLGWRNIRHPSPFCLRSLSKIPYQNQISYISMIHWVTLINHYIYAYVSHKLSCGLH